MTSFAFMWPYLLLLILFKRPDLINPQSREDQIILSLLKPLHRKPVIWKDAGDYRYYLHAKTRLFPMILQSLLLKAIKKADAIYTVTKDDELNTVQFLRKSGFSKDEINKVSIIPSDILFADYDIHAVPHKKSSNLVVGTITRLDEFKGVQYLLEAARSLSKKHKNLEFWIVGDGPFRTELKTLSDGLDNVTFFGHQDDISPYLVGMDIFVQPAEFEGWGRSVKEAMYFGKPVVGSNVGGIAEQIEDGKTGLLFEPKSATQLKERLDKLIKDKELRTKLGKAARAKALGDGDYVDLVKTQILPLFEQALNRSHG